MRKLLVVFVWGCYVYQILLNREKIYKLVANASKDLAGRYWWQFSEVFFFLFLNLLLIYVMYITRLLRSIGTVQVFSVLFSNLISKGVVLLTGSMGPFTYATRLGGGGSRLVCYGLLRWGGGGLNLCNVTKKMSTSRKIWERKEWA